MGSGRAAGDAADAKRARRFQRCDSEENCISKPDEDDFGGTFGEMPEETKGLPETAAPASIASPGARIGGSGSSEPSMPPPLSGTAPPQPAGPLKADDFLIYPAKNKCIYRPTREFWSI
jgi:hypothetical protein